MKIILLGFMLFGLLGSVSSEKAEDKVANACIAAESDFLIILEQISFHITGRSTLSNTQITSAQAALENDIELLINNQTVIYEALQLVALFETVKGPLFVSGSTTNGGFTRAGSGLELERFMFYLQQSIMDYSYTEENLMAYPQLFTNFKYETSSYFPGAATPPSNSNVSYTVKIDGNHIRNWGTPINYETEDARRPTGCYLAPGSIATVTVPSSLVGKGASVLVGAHTWDNKVKPTTRRLDRVTKVYEIDSQTVTVANPLGGGIYINIPFESSLGMVNVTIKNVIRSPYFANTVANKTSVSDWQNIERQYQAPWADFETDKVMHQVPTSWIYNVDDPSLALNDWDLAMDAVSELHGRPLVRSKTVAYQQVDLQLRGSAFYPGYPQANIIYDPNIDYGGNYNHFLVKGPRDGSQALLDVFFHELGHAEKVYKFEGEIESYVNFLFVAVYNKKFGLDLDTAFVESSTTNNKHTLDEAAISWMMAENFRLGNPMSFTTGQFRQEFHYQPRGYAKYVEIVDLFGWEALENYYTLVNENYMNGVYNYSSDVNAIPTDERIYEMSISSGYDLRPLLHFWGKHPEDFNGLANSIQQSGVEQSVEIYDRLQYYKTIVPMDNDTFREFGLNDYSESAIVNYNNIYVNNVDQSYYQGFLNKFWDSYSVDEGQAAINEIQNIIDLYFPDGRPNEEKITFVPDPDKTYYIDAPIHNLRLAADGEDLMPKTTSTSTVGEDVEWKFVAKGNGSWHIQRAAGGTLPRLRTDNSTSLDGTAADMQGTAWSGVYTYFDFEEGAIEGTYFITLPDGPAAHVRLQVDNSGNVQMVENTRNGTWESFKITEVQNTGAPIGQTIWLQSLANDKYVRNYDTNGDLIEANTTNEQGVWVPFIIEDAGDGMIALKSGANGKYVAADIGISEDAPLYANRDKIGSWEKFTWINNSDGTISLQANSSGNYVVSDMTLGDNLPLVANRTAIGLWEKFYWGTFSASKELGTDTDVQIYPNPVASSATIANAAGSTLNVYDMSGSIVFTKFISSESETIDLSELTSGVYHAKTNNEINKIITIKIVKD